MQYPLSIVKKNESLQQKIKIVYPSCSNLFLLCIPSGLPSTCILNSADVFDLAYVDGILFMSRNKKSCLCLFPYYRLNFAGSGAKNNVM